MQALNHTLKTDYLDGKEMYSEYRMRYGVDQAKEICGRYINMQLRAIGENRLSDPYSERQFLRGVYFAMIAD